MAEMFQLDYGYRVRITEGEHKGKEGFVVMGSRFGDVGISTSNPPTRGYQLRVPTSWLEILSRDNPHNIPKIKGVLSIFEGDRILISCRNPQYTVDHPEYFSQESVKLAKDLLELRAKRAD